MTYIAIVPRCGNDFSIETRDDDYIETWYNGSCVIEAQKYLNSLLKHKPDLPVYLQGWDSKSCPLSGYLFRLRSSDRGYHSAFFRNCLDPFENRKIYSKMNPESSVSFQMIGT